MRFAEAFIALGITFPLTCFGIGLAANFDSYVLPAYKCRFRTTTITLDEAERFENSRLDPSDSLGHAIDWTSEAYYRQGNTPKDRVASLNANDYIAFSDSTQALRISCQNSTDLPIVNAIRYYTLRSPLAWKVNFDSTAGKSPNGYLVFYTFEGETEQKARERAELGELK